MSFGDRLYYIVCSSFYSLFALTSGTRTVLRIIAVQSGAENGDAFAAVLDCILFGISVPGAFIHMRGIKR